MIACQADGDELVAIAVGLWRSAEPSPSPTALILEITQDGETEPYMLPLSQAGLVAHTVCTLLQAAARG